MTNNANLPPINFRNAYLDFQLYTPNRPLKHCGDVLEKYQESSIMMASVVNVPPLFALLVRHWDTAARLSLEEITGSRDTKLEDFLRNSTKDKIDILDNLTSEKMHLDIGELTEKQKLVSK